MNRCQNRLLLSLFSLWRSIAFTTAIVLSTASAGLHAASPAAADQDHLAQVVLARNGLKASTSEISSTLGWQTTSVQVRQGDTYRVRQTSGTWTIDHRNFGYVDGNGYPPEIDEQIFQGCKVDQSLTYGTLLGRIGDGNAFRVGTELTFRAARSGTLELRINDEDPCLDDNDGALVVQVDKPQPSHIEKYVEVVETVWDIVTIGNTICKLAICNGAWSNSAASAAIRNFDNFRTIGNLALLVPQSIQLGHDLKEYNRIYVQSEGNSQSPAVRAAARKVIESNKRVHRALLSLVPGLRFVFPVPNVTVP